MFGLSSVMAGLVIVTRATGNSCFKTAKVSIESTIVQRTLTSRLALYEHLSKFEIRLGVHPVSSRPSYYQRLKCPRGTVLRLKILEVASDNTPSQYIIIYL